MTRKYWDTGSGQRQLHGHEDEITKLFRSGLSLAKIGARYGMVGTSVRNLLVELGEYNRQVECKLPECDTTFPFRPRKLYCTNLHARRANARDRNSRPAEQFKIRARNKLRRHVYEGRILRPKTCERCGKKAGFAKDGRNLLQADHHHGYEPEHALDVWWICTGCDRDVEKFRRGGKTVNKESPSGCH